MTSFSHQQNTQKLEIIIFVEYGSFKAVKTMEDDAQDELISIYLMLFQLPVYCVCCFLMSLLNSYFFPQSSLCPVKPSTYGTQRCRKGFIKVYVPIKHLGNKSKRTEIPPLLNNTNKYADKNQTLHCKIKPPCNRV